MSVRFYSHSTVVAGKFVEVILSGTVIDRIAINGGRESALLVETEKGPQVVRACDVR